jgi:hypothetical protein
VVDRDNLPTFLVIGAMKAGTTSLYEYLRAHPQVFMATPKELHFFPESKHWHDGVEWYASHFTGDGARAARARGEISPSYSQADQFPGVAARVAQIVPDAKIVYLVREPVARAQSMYLHEVAAGRETLPIEDALATKPLYVNSSRYASQLDEYLPHFAREQLFVFTSESLRADRARTLHRLFAFLDVDPDVPLAPVEDERGHTGDKRTRRALWHHLRDNRAYRTVVDHTPAALRRLGQRALTRPIDVDAGVLGDAAVAQLRDEFRPEVARLREFLPADFDGWGY